MLGRPHSVVAEAIGELDLRDAFVKGAPLAFRRGLQDLDFEQDRKFHETPGGGAIVSEQGLSGDLVIW
jgi:hypothetical protein